MTKSSRLRATVVLVLAALLLPSCGQNDEDRERLETLEQSIADELRALREEVAAARLAPDDKVEIELQGVGINTKIRIVDPPRKPSCENPQSNCGREVQWILRGSLPQDWYVQIEEKSTSPDKGCFVGPRFTQSERRKMSGEPAESCRHEGAAWEYSVTLFDQDGNARSEVDPLVVMDWSA